MFVCIYIRHSRGGKIIYTTIISRTLIRHYFYTTVYFFCMYCIFGITMAYQINQIIFLFCYRFVLDTYTYVYTASTVELGFEWVNNQINIVLSESPLSRSDEPFSTCAKAMYWADCHKSPKFNTRLHFDVLYQIRGGPHRFWRVKWPYVHISKWPRIELVHTKFQFALHILWYNLLSCIL